jgi:hypothetical protein
LPGTFTFSLTRRFQSYIASSCLNRVSTLSTSSAGAERKRQPVDQRQADS